MKKFQSTTKTKQRSASARKAAPPRGRRLKPDAASDPQSAPKSSSTSHIITSLDDIATGVRALRRKCPHLRAAHDLAGNPPLRRNPGGFSGLARIIVGQQLSVSAAGAIWSRTEALVAPMRPSTLLAQNDTALRAAGLSFGKIKTLRAVATACNEGLDLDRLAIMSEDDARTALTAVSGIGPWTADIYLMFCVGRADVFAPGDLALQIAAQSAMNLPERPTAKEMAAIAERWSPWRGVAARILWHYYAVEKARRTLMPV